MKSLSLCASFSSASAIPLFDFGDIAAQAANFAFEANLFALQWPKSLLVDEAALEQRQHTVEFALVENNFLVARRKLQARGPRVRSGVARSVV